jgi:hypothetical protein
MSPQHVRGKQDVQYPQAGHSATHGRMQQIRDKSGILVEEEIVIPISHPGDKDQQNTEQKNVETKQHAKEGSHTGTA